MALSAKRVRAFSDPGLCSDGSGLHLFITIAGRKSWLLRIAVDGYRLDIGLGEYPSVRSERPRKKAPKLQDAIAEYKNPMSEREKATYAIHMTNRPQSKLNQLVSPLMTPCWPYRRLAPLQSTTVPGSWVGSGYD